MTQEFIMPPDGTSIGCRTNNGAMWFAGWSGRKKSPAIVYCQHAGNLINPALYERVAVFDKAADRDFVLQLHEAFVVHAQPAGGTGMARPAPQSVSLDSVAQPTLETATDEQLKAEYDKRQQAKRAAANRLRRDTHYLVCANLDALLELCPSHDRTSCSDQQCTNYTSDPAAHRHRCTRCQLLHLKRNVTDGVVDHTGPYRVVIDLIYDALEDE